METAVQPPKPISVLKAETAEKTGEASDIPAIWFRSPVLEIKKTSAIL